MTKFQTGYSSTSPHRRLAGCAVGLALLAGCTTVMSGTPSAGDGSSGDGAQPGSASSPATSSSDPQSEALQAPASTSTDLIAAALESGEIDEPTSLLYRTYLYFGDPQLPDEFVGAPAPYELGLLATVRSNLDDMPSDIRARIEPYLLRPANPDSVFNDGGPPGLRGGTGGSLIRASGDSGSPTTCTDGWDTKPVEGLPFRIWACRNIRGTDNSAVATTMAAVAGMIKEYVPEMVADIRPLILDDPAQQSDPRADERIDVYVLPPGWLGPHRENQGPAPEYARTTEALPRAGVSTSSYVMVSSDHFDDFPLMERMVVHELFHAFQNAYNAHVTARWWKEGSAEWAASYYVRYDSARLHAVRLPLLQNHRLMSIMADVGKRPYGAYLWPLFMEQEVGPEAIFATWKALGGAPSGAGNAAVIAALNTQLNVSANFPEFVMRLLNEAYLQGDPIHPRFVNLDSHFPDGQIPYMVPRTLGSDPLSIDVSALENLGYRYYQVKVPPLDGASPDKGVMVKITGTVATGSGGPVTVEGVVRGIDGNYRRVPISYVGDGTDVCVTKEMYLVVSNPTTQQDVANGAIDLERLKKKPCSRVEVTDPETLVRFAKTGDTVTVDGTEDDGKPGTAPILITVFDVRTKLVGEYRVEITLSGGTLTAPQHMTWPLDEFEVVVPEKKYRKRDVIALDKDLTDANRDFAIAARLIRKTDEIDKHTPTVKLQGLKPCDPEETDVTCELVGDVNFTVDFRYERSGSSEDGQTTTQNLIALNLEARLAVRTTATAHGEKYHRLYPNAGSHWTINGGYQKSSVQCDAVGTCAQLVGARGTYSADTEITHSLDPGAPNARTTTPAAGDRAHTMNQQGVEIGLSEVGLPPTLGAIVGVRVDITNPDGTTETRYEPWSLTCPTPEKYAPSDGDLGLLDVQIWVWGTSIPVGDPAVGTWNDDRNELTFNCSVSESGPWGHVRAALTGALHLVPVAAS